MQAALRQQRRQGQLSAQAVKRLDADLAAVSDRFLASLNVMFRFGTFSADLTSRGRPRVPPSGVPALLVCEPAVPALSCRDMNGDDSAPVGGGIYQALPAPDWRPAPPQQSDDLATRCDDPRTPADRGRTAPPDRSAEVLHYAGLGLVGAPPQRAAPPSSR